MQADRTADFSVGLGLNQSPGRTARHLTGHEDLGSSASAQDASRISTEIQMT